jgi:hypothetical protein
LHRRFGGLLMSKNWHGEREESLLYTPSLDGANEL